MRGNRLALKHDGRYKEGNADMRKCIFSSKGNRGVLPLITEAGGPTRPDDAVFPWCLGDEVIWA